MIHYWLIVCNFADDNTLYYCEHTTENVTKNVQLYPKIVLKWFRNNQVMTNLGNIQPLKIGIEGFQLEPAKSVKLLGITIDHNLTFDTHVSNICKTASGKVTLKQN